MKMKWIRKQIKEPKEIENLKYLMVLSPELLPHIKKITKDYYILERCERICAEDISSINFHKLYLNLLVPLYKTKRKSFTPGIYKYFAPSSLNHECTSQQYILHITSKLEEIIREVSTQIPELSEEEMFIDLLKFINIDTIYLKDWKPINGYSLLHGDLHIGNIVKVNSGFRLIDFEYLRYGAVELETANLIISSLIDQYKQNRDDGELSKLSDNYVRVVSKLPLIDNISFKFFFIFSISLFYLSFYIKEYSIGLEAIRKIINQHLTRE